jgi:F-type H+/Na+-transporting ATPase subunit alpha
MFMTDESKPTMKDQIIESIKQQIADINAMPSEQASGTVTRASDGIAKVYGLSKVKYNELLEFPGDTYGIALNLEEDSIGAIILGEYAHIKQGDEVKSTGAIVSVPVGENLIGRVVNPLGQPLDEKGDINEAAQYPIEKIAPGVIAREPVTVPLQTGIKAIDGMIPVGRGQRELIIGDRQTGKTAIAIDTIINQKDQNVICIYVAIGQKESKVARIVAKLEEAGAMNHTIVVTSGASDAAALSYIAPYAGCAMGEYFMDKGKDVLVIYDDLSKHAWAYRQISLLLRRPPGRDAYPGDVFYLHSRLLERAARLNKDHGGGSLTALPIIETQAADVSAYIPTNVISITDGQIYLETDLFYQGVKPAINAGLSVSRVGSNAQIKAMKQVASKLRLDAAQFRELAAFAQFGSDLDKETQSKITRGQRVQEILKQDQYRPMKTEDQIISIFAVTRGLLDDVDVQHVRTFEHDLHEFINRKYSDIKKTIITEKVISEPIEQQLEQAITEFKQTEFAAKQAPAATTTDNQ